MGNVRKNNEDNFFINGEYKSNSDANHHGIFDQNKYSVYCYAVCDGMGGYEYGEKASLEAVKSLNDVYSEKKTFNLVESILLANKRVCELTNDGNKVKMGTTIVVLQIKGKNARFANIGDSRLYLFRDNSLKQLSQDHTTARQLIELGIIDSEQVRQNKKNHELTQYLGINEEEFLIEPFCGDSIVVKKGDVFLLCSDGVTDMLSDEEICDLLKAHKTSESSKDDVKKIIEKTLDNGGKDNITVVITRAI